MKTLQVSDELFEKLRTFVVDPFEDTPEVILDRLMDIVDKAKQKWSPVSEVAVSRKKNPAEALSDEQPGDLHYRPANEVAAIG